MHVLKMQDAKRKIDKKNKEKKNSKTIYPIVAKYR